MVVALVHKLCYNKTTVLGAASNIAALFYYMHKIITYSQKKITTN